jgi:hypothetical protein
MGLAVVFWHSYSRNWVEAYKKRKWRQEQRDDIDDIIAAFPNAPPIVHISKCNLYRELFNSGEDQL